MGGNRKVSYLIFLVTLTVTLLFAAPAYASDILSFTNREYGYNFETEFDWIVDLSAYPDTVVMGIGEGGRLVVDVITIDDEFGQPTSQDYADIALAGLESGFEEFVILDEAWSVSPRRLEVYDIIFEFMVDCETMYGTARVAIGAITLLAVYYDDPSDYAYYLPDISHSFRTITIDESFLDPVMEIEITDGEPLEFINPSIILYKNETYFYECPNPPGLMPEEINGPAWIVFSTGEGEIAIRYLDLYYNSGKTADAILDEMIPELLAAFARYETLEGIDIFLGDGRPGHIQHLDAVYNGCDWQGTFVCFESDYAEPFLLSILAPAEEHDLNIGVLYMMWTSFTFVEDI